MELEREASMRTKFTLSVEEDLRQEIKIQAVRENRDVSDITEELYREYLASTAGKTQIQRAVLADRLKKAKGKAVKPRQERKKTQ
jgi:hypothetical protein